MLMHHLLPCTGVKQSSYGQDEAEAFEARSFMHLYMAMHHGSRKKITAGPATLEQVLCID